MYTYRPPVPIPVPFRRLILCLSTYRRRLIFGPVKGERVFVNDLRMLPMLRFTGVATLIFFPPT